MRITLTWECPGLYRPGWILRKIDLPPVPILLGLVLGKMTETNFRRALLVSDGDPQHLLQQHLLQDLLWC